MIYYAKVAEQARLDLKAIYEYIANILMAPIVAEKQYFRIEDAIYSLDKMPERFRQYEKELDDSVWQDN